MPIRHFDIYISERQLIQKTPISQLKGAKIGIEGQYWLRKIIKPNRSSITSDAKILENITANIVSMGGTFPYNSFKTLLEKEINKIRSLDIYPFFVFNGLSFLRKDKPFTIEDTRPNKRSSGWDHYERGRLESAHNTWSSSNSVHQNEFMNSVFKIFQENNIEFMRAPYSSWAQLAYLQQKGYVQSVYSGSEMLMWCGDSDNVILNIDFDKKEFTWIEKIRVIQDLNLIHPDHFIDICMLAGFDWISTFPPLVGSKNISFTFKGTVDMLQQYRTGFNAIQAFAENPKVKEYNYEDNFCRIKSIINHNIILKDDGTTEPLNKETAPNDLHELFGPRLPDEVYFYMCQGMVSPQVITNLVSGMLLEGPPLCNGDTIEYREFIKSQSLLDLRTQALSLLTMGMSSFIRNRKVNSIFWFDPSHEVQLHHKNEPVGVRWLPPNKIAQINKSKQNDKENDKENENDNENENENNNEEGKEKEKLNKNKESSIKTNTVPIYSLTNNIDWIESHKKKEKDFSISNINLLFCLQTIANQSQIQLNVPTNQNANNLKNSKNNNLSPFDLKYVRNVDDIYALVLLRFLEARNFIELKSSKSNSSNSSANYVFGSYHFTPYGKALQKALSLAPSSAIFQEEIVTALELIRMNVLNNKAYNRVPYTKLGSMLSSPISSSTPSTPNKDGNDVKEHINLISRVASLLHISFKSMIAWNGPLDLELLRFNSFMKAVTRSLRNLCEMILLSMAMNENAGKSDSNLEILSTGIKLPFLLDANTANGIITKNYLDSLTDIINITTEVIQKSTTAVETKFQEYCDNVKSNMENTYKLWDCILEAVKSLKADGQISEEYAREFIDANEWLKDKRPIFN
jgi:5'-3' exonuclease